MATLVWLALCGPPPPTAAQTVPDSARTADEPLRVFVDCGSRYCDFDHIRREIDFVSYVRDRLDAQVHVLITTRPTGGGATERVIPGQLRRTRPNAATGCAVWLYRGAGRGCP